jgi:hypothetical protein
MKRAIASVILLLLFAKVFPQSSSLAIFTQEPERFSVVLNGILQNSRPETNIQVTDLQIPSCRIRILFEDTGIPAIGKTIFLKPGTDFTYQVMKDSSGQWVLQYINKSGTGKEASPPSGDQMVVVYTTVPALQNTRSTSTPGTTTIPAGGMTTTTPTTQTESTVVEANQGNKNNVLPGYAGPTGCDRPVSKQDFDNAWTMIYEQKSDDTMLTMARQFAQSNCLLSFQVMEIMKLFTYEQSRLDFAEFAYDHTYDTGNFDRVNGAFDDRSSVGALDSYIKAKNKK